MRSSPQEKTSTKSWKETKLQVISCTYLSHRMNSHLWLHLLGNLMKEPILDFLPGRPEGIPPSTTFYPWLTSNKKYRVVLEESQQLFSIASDIQSHSRNHECLHATAYRAVSLPLQRKLWTTLALSLPFQGSGHQILSVFPAGHPGGEVTGAQATSTCSQPLCLYQNLLPSQSCHFYFLSAAGHHPALCLPPDSRVLAPGRERKSRILMLGPGEPHLDMGFQILSITAAHHKQWPVLSPSQILTWPVLLQLGRQHSHLSSSWEQENRDQQNKTIYII